MAPRMTLEQKGTLWLDVTGHLGEAAVCPVQLSATRKSCGFWRMVKCRAWWVSHAGLWASLSHRPHWKPSDTCELRSPTGSLCVASILGPLRYLVILRKCDGHGCYTQETCGAGRWVDRVVQHAAPSSRRSSLVWLHVFLSKVCPYMCGCVDSCTQLHGIRALCSWVTGISGSSV